MDLTNQPGVQANNQQIMELRQAVASYVTEYKQALIAHPSFDGEAGVNNLYGLLMTQGQWNEDAGDLVAPILARVLGREVRILESAQQGGFYEVNDNRIFRPQDSALPAGKPDTGQPPIHLLHTGDGSHYQYLEPRFSQADGMPTTVSLNPAAKIDLSKLHEHFGIDDVDMITLENWRNEDWGNSAFIRLSDSRKPVCVSMSALQHCFEDTVFANAVGGDAEGHYSTLGDERYLKVPTDNLTIYLLTNQENKTSIDHLKQHVNNTDNELAAVLSLEFMHKARIASVALNPEGLERVGRGSSVSHGQSEYSVYKLVGHQKKSIEQAEELARNGKSLFDGSGVVDKSLNRQGGSRPTHESFQPPRRRPPNPQLRLHQQGIIAEPRPPQDERYMEVERQDPRTQIRNAFTQANNLGFEALTQNQQYNEVLRICQETGHSRSEVLFTLIAGINRPVARQDPRTQIMNAFTQANDHGFEALTQNQQYNEVRRISQETGHTRSDVLFTLIAQINGPVERQDSSIQIMNAFTQANDSGFRSLTQDQQYNEVLRICQETGHSRLEVLITLIAGINNRPVERQDARTQIMNAFTQANDHAYEALTQDQQYNEVLRICQETGHSRLEVLITLMGGIERILEG